MAGSHGQGTQSGALDFHGNGQVAVTDQGDFAFVGVDTRDLSHQSLIGQDGRAGLDALTLPAFQQDLLDEGVARATDESADPPGKSGGASELHQGV